jgi:hypothetical protein
MIFIEGGLFLLAEKLKKTGCRQGMAIGTPNL